MMNDMNVKNIYQYSINGISFNEWISSKIPALSNVKVVELGTNSGLIWNNLRTRFINSEITICDDNKRRLDYVKHNLVEYNFKYEQTEFHKLPFDDGELDVVISNHNLYRSKDLRRVLDEVKRVLRVGGIFIATTNSSNHLSELSDLMTPYGIVDYFGRGLIKTFDFEGGRPKLEGYFEVVSADVFENVLNVTDIYSVLSYLKSLDDPQINLMLRVRRMEIVNQINNRIMDEGAFKITARPGMFICLRK